MNDPTVMASNVAGNRVARKASPDSTHLPLDTLKVSISRLSDADVDQMNRKDLIDLVKFSGLEPLSNDGRAHLAYLDDQELKRLACLARYVCRRSVDSAYIDRGMQSPFHGCI